MKIVGVIAKILAALAAVAGAVYVLATYGDKIVEWAKKILNALPKCECCDCCEVEPDEEDVVEEAVEAAAEAVEEAAEAVEEAVEEVVEEIASEEVVADEADFEG